ncbi:hypothetical protein [Nonomuraea sp. NPDC049141]
MMPHLALAALAVFAFLTGVYLYSANEARRGRAWRLLRLLLRR